jgi:hypothetical protein
MVSLLVVLVYLSIMYLVSIFIGDWINEFLT